ncbi:preprotein translocase subunit SecE [Candidatus Woesebacteria bacterium]|nr:preprotein translocase subunit SecE [Candidatus Woesebacteria bacterium]
MNTVVGFLSEVRLELSKVVWPKRREVIRLTLIVLIISLIFGAFTGGLDFFFTKALEFFVSG